MEKLNLVSSKLKALFTTSGCWLGVVGAAGRAEEAKPFGKKKKQHAALINRENC